MKTEAYFIAFILLAGGLATVRLHKLTPGAAIIGIIIGGVLYAGTGYIGLLLMIAFFILGTLASGWKKKYKESLGAAEANKGQRKVSQVVANAGVAGILAFLAMLYPSVKPLFLVMIAASFSSATADTISSELGTVYGKKFYNIISLKKEKPGLDGVISMEGTLFGIAGSIIIAVLYALHTGPSLLFFWIVIAGTIGNLSDSVLGALLERKQLLKNDSVNFLNTLIAALVGGLLTTSF